MSRFGTYHHGNLRRALFDALADAVLEGGPSGTSLRELARRAGVSHAAPAHHFGDKRGLLTAFAAEGHRLLADTLAEAAREADGDFAEVGVAYVRFALTHRAHFEVMFRPDQLDREDPELTAAAERTSRRLREGVTGDDTGSALGPAGLVAPWALVHGLATLWLTGNVPDALGPPERLARQVLDAVDWRR